MVKRTIAAVLLTFGIAAFVSAAPKLTVNVKDGDVISGDFTFRVKVESDQLITQVEFYVGEDLRDSDSSTPYEFKLDTLAESEGPIKVTFAAYTSEGENAKKSITVTVDNGISQGAEKLAEKGAELLSVSQWDEAISTGRAALKAKPGFIPGLLLLARAYYGKGVMDSAQKYAEDALMAEANNLQALNLVSAIGLQRAFNTYNRGGDQKETIDTINAALKAAVAARTKVLAFNVDSMGAVTDSNRIKYAEVTTAASRYSLAIDALDRAFLGDTANATFANLLIYAQLRAGRDKDAARTMDVYTKGGNVDAFGHALNAIIQDRAGDRAKSQDEIKEALLSDAENMGVRTANAYLALRRNDTAALSRIATDLSRDAGQLSIVNYYLSTVLYRLGQFEESRRAAEKALLAEPSSYDMYIELGNQAIDRAINGKFDEATKAKSIAFQYDLAGGMFRAALEAKPDSVEALTGLSALNLLLKNTPEALKYAEAAIAAGKDYPGGFYALSCALLQESNNLRAQKRDADAARKSAEAQQAITSAGNLDTVILRGRPIPGTDGKEVWKYFMRYGVRPYLAPGN